LESEDVAPLVLHLDTRSKYEIGFTPWKLYPLGRTTRSLLLCRLHVKDSQSEHFKENTWLFKNSNLKISFRTKNTIRELLTRNKNIIPNKFNKFGVYQYNLLKKWYFFLKRKRRSYERLVMNSLYLKMF